MYIKYNHLSIVIISISIVTALANYAFAKTKKTCFTCACKTNTGNTVISKPNCNFESLLTNKSHDELPSEHEIKQECVQTCRDQNQKYSKHMIWSE